MGNRFSASDNGGPTTTTLNNNDNTAVDDDESLPVNESGVFLSDKLKEQIVGSFQSQVLQTEWEKFQLDLITNHNKRITDDDRHRVVIDEEMNKWREQNRTIQKDLDERIDARQAKFQDLQVANQYDLQKLEEKLRKYPPPKVVLDGMDGKDVCLDERNAALTCFSTQAAKDDIRTCNNVLDAMELCVKKTILS